MRNNDGIKQDEINNLFYKNAKFYPDINSNLYNISTTLGITFFDSDELICEKTTQQCFGTDNKLMKNFYDYSHFTVEGGKFFGSQIPVKWPKFMTLQ